MKFSRLEGRITNYYRKKNEKAKWTLSSIIYARVSTTKYGCHKCKCTCMYMCIRVCLYVCALCVFSFMCIHAFVQMYVSMHACEYVFILMHMYVYMYNIYKVSIHLYVHMCFLIYIHVHKRYMHILAYTCLYFQMMCTHEVEQEKLWIL